MSKKMIEQAAYDKNDPLAERLVQEFGTSEIPLACMCNKYLGIDVTAASKKAGLHQLPMPVYRFANSQKSPWLVNVDQLAKYLRSVPAEAEQEYLQCQA